MFFSSNKDNTNIEDANRIAIDELQNTVTKFNKSIIARISRLEERVVDVEKFIRAQNKSSPSTTIHKIASVSMPTAIVSVTDAIEKTFDIAQSTKIRGQFMSMTMLMMACGIQNPTKMQRAEASMHLLKSGVKRTKRSFWGYYLILKD
jgi:hypothetical protein